jgi:hypothetical protein
LRRREPAADLQVFAVGQRQEIRERPLDDPQAVLGQAQVAHDLRIAAG